MPAQRPPCSHEAERALTAIVDVELYLRAQTGSGIPPLSADRAALVDPTIADAICDRLVHNAHVLKLGGPSIRKKKALEPQPQTA